jgi:UDP-N-acetylmuramyl tripeptide synthase
MDMILKKNFNSAYNFLKGPNFYGRDPMMRHVIEDPLGKERRLGEKIKEVLKSLSKDSKVTVERTFDNQFTLISFECKSAEEGKWIIKKARLIQKKRKNGVAKLLVRLKKEYSRKKWNYTQVKKPKIPVIFVSGTNGKTTTVNLIAYLLYKTTNLRVGRTTSNGVYINDKTLYDVHDRASEYAEEIIFKKKVDIAVIEQPRAGLYKLGLPVQHHDIGLLTEIKKDHFPTLLTKNMEQYVKTKKLIYEYASKVIVINANDKRLMRLSKDYNTKKVYFSSTRNDTAKKLIRRGEEVYTIKDGWFLKYRNGKEIRIVHISDVPYTFNGRSLFNIENTLAALSVVFNVKIRHIKLRLVNKCLKEFMPSFELNPGRQNTIDYGKFQVFLDYAHNPDGFRNIFTIIKNMDANRKVGLLSCYGDRNYAFMKKLCSVAAEYLDFVYLKNPDPLHSMRGKKLGEVPVILKKYCDKEKLHNEIISRRKHDTRNVEFKVFVKKLKKGDLGIILGAGMDNILKVYQDIKPRCK